MADTAELRDRMAQAITTATHVSLHTGSPEGSGANEVTGGSPAYARVAITGWAQVVPGTYEATLAGGGVFNVPANTDIVWAGLWEGATYLDKAAAFASTITQDTVTLLEVLFTVPEAA